MDSDLSRLEELYNCDFYKTNLGEQDFIELHTLNVLTKQNLGHIGFVLKQNGYYFYKIEALFDNLIITYYKK